MVLFLQFTGEQFWFLNGTTLKNKATPLMSYNISLENAKKEKMNDYYIQNITNQLALNIVTKDKFNYEHEIKNERVFENFTKQLWEKKSQDGEGYFILINPLFKKVLSAQENKLSALGKLIFNLIDTLNLSSHLRYSDLKKDPLF